MSDRKVAQNRAPILSEDRSRNENQNRDGSHRHFESRKIVKNEFLKSVAHDHDSEPHKIRSNMMKKYVQQQPRNRTTKEQNVHR